jgi:hypothetical protein
MNIRATTLAFFARLAAVAILANVALVACMPSSEGEMSDEEKLKAMNKGRSEYGKAQPATTGN